VVLSLGGSRQTNWFTQFSPPSPSTSGDESRPWPRHPEGECEFTITDSPLFTGDLWFSPIVQDWDAPWVRMYCARKRQQLPDRERAVPGPAWTGNSPIGYGPTHAVWMTFGDVTTAGDNLAYFAWVEKPTSNGPDLAITRFPQPGNPTLGTAAQFAIVDNVGDLWLFCIQRNTATASPRPNMLKLFKMPGPGRSGTGTWVDMTPWTLGRPVVSRRARRRLNGLCRA